MKKIITTLCILILAQSVSSEYLIKLKTGLNSTEFKEPEIPLPQGLSQEEFSFLKESITQNKWTICYESPSDIDNAAFHSGCDSYSTTLTIAEDTNSGKKVAGYSEVSWGSKNGSFVDNSLANAKLFSITNKTVHLPYQYLNRAVYVHSNYGPVFGGAHDLALSSGTNFYCSQKTFENWSRSLCHNNNISVYPTRPKIVIYGLE